MTTVACKIRNNDGIEPERTHVAMDNVRGEKRLAALVISYDRYGLQKNMDTKN